MNFSQIIKPDIKTELLDFGSDRDRALFNLYIFWNFHFPLTVFFNFFLIRIIFEKKNEDKIFEMFSLK